LWNPIKEIYDNYMSKWWEWQRNFMNRTDGWMATHIKKSFGGSEALEVCLVDVILAKPAELYGNFNVENV
jgi:hypothetical protein